jgi:hypothetical protein
MAPINRSYPGFAAWAPTINHSQNNKWGATPFGNHYYSVSSEPSSSVPCEYRASVSSSLGYAHHRFVIRVDRWRADPSKNGSSAFLEGVFA